ncbi:hypothetical protein WN943_025933 [Citrus x changshan-huyou]|nr:hypothetical protein CUMW_258520 [Citrus unshiu]
MHKPPKSLDEDEAQFLDGWESYEKEKERRLADEDALELRCFRTAVESQCVASKETLTSHDDDHHHQQRVIIGKKNPASCPLSSIMKVVLLAKKPKKDVQSVAAESSSNTLKKIDAAEKSPEPTMLKRNRGDADS